MISIPLWARLDPEIREALAEGTPVVALESSVWCQGLPRPLNFEVALEVLAQVRRAKAVPAVVWLEDGALCYGCDQDKLEELCQKDEVAKVGVGDLAGILSTRALGATTVSATLVAAEQVGIRVLATGGVGGVHRGWAVRPDISADLAQLARTRCLTVCSGVKSVIDIPSTLEALESLGVPVCLYRCDEFPQFYTLGEPIEIGFRLNTPAEVARAHELSLQLSYRGLMVNQPVPEAYALPQVEMDAWMADGMIRAESERQVGKSITPFLLDHLARVSAGRTLEANRALLVANAYLAAQISVALAELHSKAAAV